jgi:ATP-dependent Zn protease
MGSMIIYSLIFGFFIIMSIFIILDKHTNSMILTDSISEMTTTNTSFSNNVKTTLQALSIGWKWIPVIGLIGLMYYAFNQSMGGEKNN